VVWSDPELENFHIDMDKVAKKSFVDLEDVI
jgi:hypothetical protein